MGDISIIFKSYIYLLLLWAVVLLYIYFLRIIYLYLKKSFIEKNIVKPDLTIFSISLKEKKIKLFLLFFLGANFILYIEQRSEWINKNTTYHNAKEYFVVGMPIIFYKKSLNLIFKADSIVMKPFDMLSHAIYKDGVALLPKDDGEKYYWQYRYFNYWYVRGAGYMPDYDPRNPKPITPQQQKILDDMYEVIEGLATSKIKDKTVNKEKYKAFIAVAKYYTLRRFIPYNEYVFNWLSDRRVAALQDKRFMQKDKNILEWTLRFQEEYKKSSKITKDIEQDTPVLGVSYYLVIDDMALDIIFSMIANKFFNCTDRYINIYIDSGRKLLSKESPLYYLSKSQQEIVTYRTFNHEYYKLIAYKLYTQCNRKVEVGYPSDEWIKNELPSMKKRWLNQDDISIDDKNIFSIDINSSNFITF